MISSWTTAMPPLLGCIILFIARHEGKPIMNFKEVMTKGVLWASIVMTGAATMLGSALTHNEMGIKAWLSGMLAPVASGLPVLGLILFFFAWCVLETNFSSNIVTTTVVSAVALSVCQALPAGVISVGAVVCLIGFGAGILQHDPGGPVYHQHRGHRVRLDHRPGYVHLGEHLRPPGHSGDDLCGISHRECGSGVRGECEEIHTLGHSASDQRPLTSDRKGL